MIVIADSAPLIALSRIGQLSLLRDTYHEVLIPPAVLREVVDRGKSRPGALEVSTAAWIHVRSASLSTFTFGRALDIGEREAILLALETPNSVLLIDDLPGRREATDQGLKIIGTIGVLIHARQNGLIPLLKPELDKLTSVRFHISEEIRRIALDAVGEGD